MTTTTLAARLRHVCASTGRKPQTLSKLAGLAPGHIGLILSGRVKGNVTPETLQAIARAAGVDYEWLATGEGGPEFRPAEPVTPRPPPVPGSEPVMSELPNWPELLSSARRMAPDIQAWAWDKLAVARPWLDEHPTPSVLVSLARVIEAHVSPPARHR